MAILAVADFKKMFGEDRVEQLASDFVSGSMTYVEVNITDVLAKAEGLVKNSLSKQYSIAQIEADDGVKRIVGDIAYYYLEFRRGTPPTAVLHLHDYARKALKALQSGDAKLSAVDQLLPDGPTDEPTEATDSGYFD